MIFFLVVEFRGILPTDLIESLVQRIRATFESLNPPRLPEITTAASLAHSRMLGSVKGLLLINLDLASVPAEHLVSLASCVKWRIDIWNDSNWDIISLLDSLKCEEFCISRQTLSSEETRALVRAMESRVKVVALGNSWGEVSLDIRALTQYSGQGKCGQVRCHGDTARRYWEELRSWARMIHWIVTVDSALTTSSIIIERKLYQSALKDYKGFF